MAKVRLVEVDLSKPHSHVEVDEGQKLDMSRPHSHDPGSGRLRHHGTTLRQLRDRLGGDTGGVMPDPLTGADVYVDLSPWLGRHPNTLISLRFYPDDPATFDAFVQERRPT